MSKKQTPNPRCKVIHVSFTSGDDQCWLTEGHKPPHMINEGFYWYMEGERSAKK